MAMNLLVMGGTVFLGRHVVAAALAAGHRVTVLNRGRGSFAWPAPVETLLADRDGPMPLLAGRHFDAVIDCSAYTPAQVHGLADALGGRAGFLVFISSISVGARFAPHQRHDEAMPVLAGDQGYGALKARAEDACQARWPQGLACVRPGLIVGPHDPTGRFAYWPARVAQGGQVLAPGRPERPVQLIDARDLAAWCLALAEARQAGLWHAVGPPGSMQELLEACRRAAGPTAPAAEWLWRPDAALLAAGARPWTGLPLWIPEDDADFGGMLLGHPARALADGLKPRPWEDTARDTLGWLRGLQGQGTLAPAGQSISAAEEAALLART